MKYICDNCKLEFSIEDDIEATYCLKCGKTYIRKETDGFKRLARIEGSLNAVMDVVIHQDGHIELLNLHRCIEINPDYEESYSREITELEYSNLL